MELSSPRSRDILALALMLMSLAVVSSVVAADPTVDLNGIWQLNEKASDDTDKQVEEAIKEAGGKIKRGGKKGKGRHKGGPEEQELYDHMAYDEILTISHQGAEFQFTYAEDFERTFSSDRRSRVATASGSSPGAREDHAFAYWDTAALLVEARPRDGGRTTEIYSIDPATGQLRVELTLKPLAFRIPIKILRIYDRAPAE